MLPLVDQPPRPVPAGFAADALRLAASIGSELKDLALPKDKAGRTVVNAASVLRVLRSLRARPIADLAEDRIPRADIDFASGLVHLDGVRWLAADERVPAESVASDARILTEYLTIFLAFFGNAPGAVKVNWALLVWLYAAPAAPYLVRPRCRSVSIHGCTRSMRCCSDAPVVARPCPPGLPYGRCSASRR